jgi:MFS transporter, SP family, general alpha glucoside:H+ symporter
MSQDPSQPQEKVASTEAAPAVNTHNGVGGEITEALKIEREMSVRDSFRFWPKAILFSFVLSLAIIMEVNQDLRL